jgi:hypothetical protein
VSIHDAELDIIYGVNLEDLEYNDSSYKDIKKNSTLLIFIINHITLNNE